MMSEQAKYLVRGLALTVVGLAGSPLTVRACETCFGAAVDSEVTRGIGFAMLLLLIVVTAVFAGILWFFMNTMNRSRMLRDGRLVPPRNPSVISPKALN